MFKKTIKRILLNIEFLHCDTLKLIHNYILYI